MPSLPAELLTLFGSSILGGIMRIWGASIQSRYMQHALSLQVLNAKSTIIRHAREYNNKTFICTRRIIALTAVFFVIAFPKIVCVFFPEISVFIGYPETTSGFMFFTSSVERISWTQLNGLVITPLDTHLLSAIVGLYFGSSLIGNR